MTSHQSTVAEFGGVAADGELDFSDPALAEAVAKVHDTGSETTWVVVGYAGNTNKLRVVADGEGDIDDMAEELEDHKILYAFTRVVQGALKKFVYICWVGEGVPAVLKGKVVTGGHARLVGERLFKNFSVQINARNEHDVDQATLMAKVKSAGGADYDAGGDKGLARRD